MNLAFRILVILVSSILFFSCNFEKRLYRSGYYIASSEKIKKRAANKTPSESLYDSWANADRASYTPLPAKKITLFQPLFVEGIKETGVGKKNRNKVSNIQKPFVKHADLTKQVLKQKTGAYTTTDDEKINKDVKLLLISSFASCIEAFACGIFSILGMQGLADLFFVLTPFSILAIWFFALLLFIKYSSEKKPAGSSKKDAQKRAITKRKAFLLAGLLGIFGVHRFYLGYTKIGIFEMLTLGGFFVLFFIDLIRIKQGKLKPAKGEYDREGSAYHEVKKKHVTNKSQKIIKIAMLISVFALLVLLGVALFL